MSKGNLNLEGYADPTAYLGIQEATKEENEVNRRAYDLVKVLKYIIRATGFELTDRIRLRDTRSGREYK